MPFNTYQKFPFKSDITLTPGGTVTYAIEIPKYMGIGGVQTYFFRLTINAGAPIVTAIWRPIKVLRPKEFPVRQLSLTDDVSNPDYALVAGAAAVTTNYFQYWSGAAYANLNAVAMTTGLWYMCPIIDANLPPFDGVEISFAEGAGAGNTGKITGELTIG